MENDIDLIEKVQKNNDQNSLFKLIERQIIKLKCYH